MRTDSKSTLGTSIFFSVYDGDTEKNFLRTGILDHLKRAGFRIILLVRAKPGSEKERYYRDSFASDFVTVEIIPPGMTTTEWYWYHLSWNTLPTRSSYVKRHDLYLRHHNQLRYFIESIAWLLGHMRVWRHFLRLAYYFIPDSYCADLFDKYKPSLLFAPNMFSPEDCRLLRVARKRRIPTLTTMKSWDVPTTRGFTRVKADRILTFNAINQRETIEIGDYHPTQVRVVGFPQFDMYSNESIYIPRDTFFQSLGIDPGKRIILFAAPGDFKNPFTDEILRLLDQAIHDGDLPRDVHILARFHPKYPSSAEKLSALKHVTKDRPGTYFTHNLEQALDAPQETTFQWTFTDIDLIHLANSLRHASVTINTESTMTLDAAANDRPIVLVGFDGNHKLDFWKSVIRNYGREHLKAVLDTGGARLAHSPEELLQHINMYLDTPTADAGGRRRIRDELLFRCDGRSALRVAEHIIEMAQTRRK